jgi:type IV pilus assembly protein PilO
MNLRQSFAVLQTLDVQAPGTWPNWVRVASAVMTAVLLIAAGFWFLVVPKRDELRGKEAQEETLFAEFERKQRKVVALDAYKQQLHEMERSFGAMLRQLPSKAEVANLLNDISQTRVASALEEELFKPEPEVVKEFYAELPNKIVVTGTYHQMGSFVSEIAALSRIVTIDEVEIKPMDPPPSAPANPRQKREPPSDQLRMTALARTYRYLDDAELEEIESEKAKKPGGQP